MEEGVSEELLAFSSVSMWQRWVPFLIGLAWPGGVVAICTSSSLLKYTVTFTAKWTRELFPKQYPEFRPPAQWSKVIGVSHSEGYRIYQLGLQASPELKMFAETGKQEFLGSQNVSSVSVLDQFILPAITNGSGSVTTNIFVDSNHSKVSLIARIIPSPDWFIGVDSLELCANGHWVDSVTEEASPIDAGTDSGLTFTAPNWATDPQEPIFKITSQYPRHRASSFYYPKLQDLPPIATLTLTKKMSYDVQPEHGQGKIVPSRDKELRTTAASTTEENPLWKRKTRRKKSSKTYDNGKNCLVGKWTEWTACNGPCGQSKRTRKVIKFGLICPPLLQERTCGCTKYIFNW